MSLSVQPLYNEMTRQFTASTQSDRFKADFIDALNNSLDELIVAGDVTASDLPHVSSESASIAYLSAHHAQIVKCGLRYNLMLLGQIPASGGTDALMLAERAWTNAQGRFMTLLSRADQSVVDTYSNPTADIIGLGYKGTAAGASEEDE